MSTTDATKVACKYDISKLKNYFGNVTGLAEELSWAPSPTSKVPQILTEGVHNLPSSFHVMQPIGLKGLAYGINPILHLARHFKVVATFTRRIG